MKTNNKDFSFRSNYISPDVLVMLEEDVVLCMSTVTAEDAPNEDSFSEGSSIIF